MDKLPCFNYGILVLWNVTFLDVNNNEHTHTYTHHEVKESNFAYEIDIDQIMKNKLGKSVMLGNGTSVRIVCVEKFEMNMHTGIKTPLEAFKSCPVLLDFLQQRV